MWLICSLPWALLFPRSKIVPALAIVLCVCVQVVLISDTFVFGLYRYHIYNEFVLHLIFGGNAGGIFVFSGAQFAIAGAALAVIVALEIFLFRVAVKLAPKIGKKIASAAIGVFAFSLIGSHFMHAYFSAHGHRDVYEIAAVYPGFFPLTANRFLIRLGWVDPEKIRKKIKTESSRALDYPRAPLVPESASGKNVLVIFIDSWNARTFEPETMPNLCKFAENAQVFQNHFSGDHGTRTGVTSFFHGLPGLYYNTLVDGGVSAALVDTFVRAEYEMGIFATAGLSSPPFHRTVFANVPSPLHDRFSERAGGVAEGDVAMTDAWIAWLAERENAPKESRKPFFGFLFYDELHAMTLPKNAEKKFPTDWTNARYEVLGKNTDPTPFWNLYKNDALWLDGQLARVFADLRARGLLENTVVIITGDHGQEFNESGANFWGHGSAFTLAQLRVPFVLFDSALAPKKFSHWTAHYDASVTLLRNYLGVKNPASDYSVGKNLFDETPREWLLVGHPERFGIVEKDRITYVGYDRTYDIYDWNYRLLEDADLNVPVMQAALEQAKTFYKK